MHSNQKLERFLVIIANGYIFIHSESTSFALKNWKKKQRKFNFNISVFFHFLTILKKIKTYLKQTNEKSIASKFLSTFFSYWKLYIMVIS